MWRGFRFIILGWLPMGLLFSFKHTWWFFSTINSDLLSEDLGAYCFRFVCYSVIPLSETLTLLITFEKWMLVLWYFTWVFHVTKSFRGHQHFWACDLDLWIWTVTLLLTWTVSSRASIFHMNILCDKTFPWAPTFLSPWPWSLTYFLKTFTLLITYDCF